MKTAAVMFGVCAAMVACSSPAKDAGSTDQAATAKYGDDWFEVTQNWAEAEDSEKALAIDDAFASLTDIFEGIVPGTRQGMADFGAATSNAAHAAGAGDASYSFSQAMVEAVKGTATKLKSDYGMLADQGIGLTDLYPSAIFLTFGGRFTKDIGIGGGGHGLIVAGLIPTKTTWKVAGDPIVHSQWKSKILLGGMIAGTVGYGVDSGAGLFFGVGGIWGTLPSADDFHGGLLGVQVSGTVPMFGLSVGLSGTAAILKRADAVSDLTSLSLDDGRTNFLAFGGWTVEALPKLSIHGVVGAAISLTQILEQAGITAKSDSDGNRVFEVAGPARVVGGTPTTTTPAAPPAATPPAAPPASSTSDAGAAADAGH